MIDHMQTIDRAEQRAPFRITCGAPVNRITYDFRTAVGKVYLPDGAAPDMAATVALFETIDPRVVQEIRTTTGIGYVRDGTRWLCVRTDRA